MTQPIPGPYKSGYVFPSKTKTPSHPDVPGPWADGYIFPDTGAAGNFLVLAPENGPHQFQQDYAPAALSMPMLGKGPFTRGYIAQDKNDPLVKGTPLGLQFLYNPTEFEQDYSLDTSRFPVNSAPGGGTDLATVGVPGASTISFTLLLDRTWDVNDPKAGMAYRYGINVDVAQFQKIVGYTTKNPWVQPVALRLVFSKTLKYFGFVASFSVLYSQFTTDMRCYRGGISNITFQILPDAPGGSTFHTEADYDPNNDPNNKDKGKSKSKGGSTSSGTGRDGKKPAPKGTSEPRPTMPGNTNGQHSPGGQWVWDGSNWNYVGASSS